MTVVSEFIVNAAETFFSIRRGNIEVNEDSLNDFIHNSHSLLLQAYISSDNLLLFNTKIQGGFSKSIVFYKNLPQVLNSEDALNHINFVTLSTDAAESLYQILKQVYNPLLTVEDDLYFSKLQKNLSDLESNLRILTHGKGAEDIKVILTIDDEVAYWKSVGQKRDANKKEREAASSFCILFEDICEEIRSLQSSPLQEVRDAAENIAGICDDIWRYTIMPYPENRMILVFDIIGHIICKVIQKDASQIDLWKAHNSIKDNEILTILTEGLNVMKTWISACKSLTETYWPNYALHPWKGKPYVPIFCNNFDNRLKEIHNIRSTYNQLTKLLTVNEKAEMNSDNFLEPFKNINIWTCSGPNQPWESAVAKFAASLRPAEARIAEKLKPRMRNTSTKQMLYEFLRYKTLINRPLVKQALSNELELFINSLIAMLKNIQSDLESDELDIKMHKPAELSSVVQQVQWAKQCENQVKEIQMCAEQYLSNFENSKTLLSLVPQVLKDLKTMYTQLHEDWARDVQSLVKQEFAISEDKPVVEFSSDTRLMVVRFEPRLVRAEGEARALTALGLAPPPGINSALQELVAPLKHARTLHQVASFHNTLGERMIPSTRPMMLAGALELAGLVREQQPLYWRDECLTQYTRNMKEMVLKLEGQNTYLTSQHLLIRGIVEKLMDTELLVKQVEWKRSIKEIRDIIEKVEANGYKNTDMWCSHWDLQLYKALECQYIKTLLSLHLHFPSVRVDLVLRGRRVRTMPAIEEVRVQHYSQLRRFLSLPAHFVGLRSSPVDEKSVFASIIDKYSWLGNKGVTQLEATLSRLQCACATWTRRLALACVDVDALCAEHLRTPEQFERNFRACKAYGQAVAKMTFEDEKIEWISVGTLTLRREFEAQSRSLWSSVAAALGASCRADAAELHAFVATATLALDDGAAPRNARDLADLSAKQQALQLKMPEMEKNVEELKRKAHLLRTWGGDASLEDGVRAWGALRDRVRAHQHMFQHQAEIVKTNLKGEWENLQSGIEAWVSRWSQAKARLEHTRDVLYEEMSERCLSVFDGVQQCDKFIADRNQLIEECEKFNMIFEISLPWKEAEDLRNDFITMWSILKDYNDEYNVLADQDWIIFQKKLHLLDDFVQKWRGLLEPYTTITLYLKQEIDKYTDLTAVLKYLRGSNFTEKHWREIFSLIEIEYVNAEALQVQHFLKVASNIKKQMKALQKINSSASNEAIIRNTLNDLEVWYAGAKLVIIYYTDKTKKHIPIVKDYKELLTKVEEQQWVVSSVGAEGAAWEARMRAARLLLRVAQHAQRRWLYLEPILCHDDGDLGTRFRKVDQAFKQISRIMETDPRLSALVQSTRLQSMLDAISEQLNACQSSLNQYIDEKRSIFPRLYFLSDDDLLELLGQARSGAEGREAIMQSHLKKLFPGITSVKLGPEDLSITALCSLEEVFPLDHPVDIDCSVELWLKKLEQEIRSSLQNMTLKCLVSNNLLEQDPFSLPTQILCLAQNIRLTEGIEKSITSKELRKLKENIENEHLYYVAAEVEGEKEKFKKQAIILQCVYYESMMKDLIQHNVVSTSDWHWQKQLRFYLLSSKEIVIKMGLAEISYSYEYLGVNTGQFVRTETTDESFLILTQSLHLGFVGNPFGPAGTGKTESVKALGALVGRLVLVFNCDEAMDAECMGRLLSGVALCGAWGCFDEFNRLSADALAAASHQLAALLQAARAARTRDGAEAALVLNGKRIVVSSWCGVAATMNPLGRGYGGRRALPPALQHALRPLALRPPPRALLASRLLAAYSSHCEPLAADLDHVFTLASTLLSNQRHYDWGLRALKSAVGSCTAAIGAREPRALAVQRAMLRHVLRLNNLSKLTVEDAERFENILSTVFAEVPEEESTTDPIYSSLKTTVVELGLVNNDLQIQKCMELYEQLRQRMGVAIVGPPGSGKTTIRKLLKSALQRAGCSVVEYVVSPKAAARGWLLGRVQASRAWSDGVLTAVAQDVAGQPGDVWSWVVCDGDIDPEWIEALNSVLDDNRLLTLPSGWRVQFGANVNFIFETHSLEHASPATISRMGIILLSNECHSAEEILESWIQKKEYENENAKMAVSLLSQITRKGLQWISTHKADVIIRNCEMSLVQQIIAQFEYNIEEANSSFNAEDVVWSSVQLSVSGLLKSNADELFYEEVELPSPLHQRVDTQTEWADSLLLSPRTCTRAPSLRAALAAARGLLVLGPNASAKNLLAEYILKESNTTVIVINCTPILEPSDIIAELKRKNAVSSSGGGGVAAGVETTRTLLLRALHRTATDQWGSSQIHSFVLQLIQQQGFWAVEESGPQWYSAGRVNVVATATTVLPSVRLSAALYPVILPEPEEDELLELSKYYLSDSVGNNITEQDLLNLSYNILSFYKEVKDSFRSQPYYKWNASHLRQWCENIKWYSPTNTGEICTALNTEARALFGERLITENDKNEYNLIVNKYFPVSNGCYFKPKLRGDGIYLEQIEYKEWYESTEKLINQCLTDDEHIFGDTGIEVCDELSVLCPIIAVTLNGGVVSLVGSAGAGRRAAARLVCAALPAALVLVDQQQHFLNMFKNALTSASEGTHTLLVVGEGVAAAEWLAYVEAFLKADSVHALPSKVIPLNLAQNPQSFTTAKHKLGIMICLDKEGSLVSLWDAQPLLRHRLCWLAPWSRSTLSAMPTLVIQRLSKESSQPMSKEDLERLPIEGFINIYMSLEMGSKRVPARYMYFIKTYYNIYNSKKQALVRRQETLSTGVEALKQTRASVASLQEEAAVQESALAEEQAKANHALEQIGATVRANTDKKEEMHNLKQTIEMENEKLQVRKKEIEAELASVEPVIAAARAAVGDIRPEALSEVRSLRAPPDVVRDVLEGVLRLMGIADTSWHSMKSFLSKRGVKEDIRCLDASQISPEAVESVERLLARRGASFEQAAARRASAACAPLAAWVRANLAHARALARVRPLQLQQRQLHQNLEEATASVSALESGLASVTERVAALQAALGEHARHAATLELRLAATARTLDAASALLNALAHEASDWDRDLQNISQEILELSQRSLLAAGYLIFLPDLTEPQARDYVSKWCTLVEYDDNLFSIINFLTTPEKLLKWEADGLPMDQSAIKNAVFIDQYVEHGCGLIPLVVDSEEGADGALAWLRATLSAADALPAHADHLHTALQCAARLGRTLVITEVERVEEWWWSVVRGTHVRAVLATRAPSVAARAAPHVRPHLAPLYFTARHHALVDQLIYYAMQKENPEINEKSKEIKITKATLQKQQHELQENLLRELSSNSDILNDANLLSSLNKTQSTSATIGVALDATVAIERDTRDACARYEASASRCARLVLAVRALAARRPLLALPAEHVRDVYVAAVDAAGKSLNDEDIVKYFTRKIVERVLLSLHKKDKYIGIMFLLQSVYDDIIPQKLWQLFIENFNIMEDKVILMDIKNKFNWIKGDCLRKITLIKMHDEDLFSRLSLEKPDMWLEFQNSGELRSISSLNINQFEKILAVMALRPESSYRAIIAFVDEVIGVNAMRSEALSAAARWSRRTRPALLLAPHAADLLAAHARSQGLTLTTVHIEEGREAWAAALAASARAWLAVVAGALPLTRDLVTFVTSLATYPEVELGEEFRLWIVAEDREIPPMLANLCVNVVIEPPEGVKRNACGTLSSWAREPYALTSAPLLARLSLLHAIVQERRNYIPLGWSRYYAWSWGDARAACEAARSAHTDAGARALLAALYAARVDAARDRDVLRALLARCLRDAMPVLDAAPQRASLNDYISALESLPDIDPPQLLELPANCRIAWENNATDNVIAGLQELNSAEVVKKGDTSSSLKTTLSLWKKHMNGSPLVKPSYYIQAKQCGWWGAACSAEARDAAGAARVLHAALGALARASPPPHLHQVPDEWQLLWAGPDSPTAYLQEFCTRARAAHDRVQSHDYPNDYMPKEVDLREFLQPQRVLEALRAAAAVRYGRPLHALALTTTWDCEDNKDSGGTVVRGLALCGARWDGALCAARAHDAPHAPAPPLLLRYVPTGEGGAGVINSSGALAEVPLYASATREAELARVWAPLRPQYSARDALLHAPALFIATHT